MPSKYWLLPDASFGTLATVILKRASLVRPQRTKKVSRRWSTGVRRPMAKAAAAGEMPKETLGRVSLFVLLDTLRLDIDIPSLPTNQAPAP